MAISGNTPPRRRRHKRQAMSEINVTPMVDVMLVLLVIFMVAAPMLTTGVEVNLPDGETSSLPQESEAPLALSVTANGALYLGEDPISEENLVSELDIIMAERQSDKIYIRADGSNSYAYIFEIMGVLSEAGYNNIGLVGEAPQNSNERSNADTLTDEN